MKNEWKYFTTNFREAWLNYRRSDEFRQTVETMKKQGIRQPYAQNILLHAFTKGWNAAGSEIKIIE